MFIHESLLELRSNPRRTRKVKSLAQAYSIDRSIDRSINQSIDRWKAAALVVLSSYGAICPSGGGETS